VRFARKKHSEKCTKNGSANYCLAKGKVDALKEEGRQKMILNIRRGILWTQQCFGGVIKSKIEKNKGKIMKFILKKENVNRRKEKSALLLGWAWPQNQICRGPWGHSPPISSQV
jgi:hypothetical protein